MKYKSSKFYIAVFLTILIVLFPLLNFIYIESYTAKLKIKTINYYKLDGQNYLTNSTLSIFNILVDSSFYKDDIKKACNIYDVNSIKKNKHLAFEFDNGAMGEVKVAVTSTDLDQAILCIESIRNKFIYIERQQLSQKLIDIKKRLIYLSSERNKLLDNLSGFGFESVLNHFNLINIISLSKDILDLNYEINEIEKLEKNYFEPAEISYEKNSISILKIIFLSLIIDFLIVYTTFLFRKFLKR